MTHIEELQELATTTANAARLHPEFNTAWGCAHNDLDILHEYCVEVIMRDVGVRDPSPMNKAMDMRINDLLSKHGFRTPGKQEDKS
jgi:hypothetical protein